MIKIEHVNVTGWEAAIRGMRNPYNSWAKSDSGMCLGHGRFNDCKSTTEKCPRVNDDFTEDVFCIGRADLNLMKQLVTSGDCHAKFARMIVVTMDTTAPLYWWKEASTYKVATVENSCSTMHTIASKPFTLDDFSHEHLGNRLYFMKMMIDNLNTIRDEYNATKDKDKWWQLIQLLPSSYNQKRTWQMDYQVLRNMYHWRKNHKLDEWVDFCKWIETLPYAAELITAEALDDSKKNR